MKFFYYLFFIFFYTTNTTVAQNAEMSQPNLVPNGSFEEFDGFPIGWYYKGVDFDNVVKYWTSPTTASPDAYGTRVRVPATWAEKGFGKHTAHSGTNFTGITVYGCVNGKPHCREYMQIQLTESLVIGQTYTINFWYAQLPKSLRVNNLGVCFSEKQVSLVGESCLKTLKPQVKAAKVLEAKNGSWARFSMKFVAKTEADWLVLGNFEEDETTNIMASPSVNGLNFAYYYIDDVTLRKLEPIKRVPIKEDDLTLLKLEVGKVITLKNIYFDSDKADLLPRSNVELNKLSSVMLANPTLEIEIIGHTDNVGAADYNLTLSRRRAAQVREFLIENGISPARMITNGFGQTQPIVKNETEGGRQMNRRVEYRILKK
ncbi:MAG: OmpA family protein [Saprospiraceae bacterium]|nr:OmpA family protein [Saprospiraceae bacterium]